MRPSSPASQRPADPILPPSRTHHLPRLFRLRQHKPVAHQDLHRRALLRDDEPPRRQGRCRPSRPTRASPRPSSTSRLRSGLGSRGRCGEASEKEGEGGGTTPSSRTQAASSRAVDVRLPSSSSATSSFGVRRCWTVKCRSLLGRSPRSILSGVAGGGFRPFLRRSAGPQYVSHSLPLLLHF